ncbi:MAG: ketoacyl-ACP synthase III [Gammaproteobacteria bacterium]|nr:ketoacyl-ACP synthase III [Gammaproteobacteria bacterium]
MTSFAHPYTRIVGTGHYLPKNVMTNEDVEKVCDTTSQWIIERTGIEQRHFCEEGESTADMAEAAARNAMESAGVEAGDIDLIIVGTSSADYGSPSVASMLQHRLGCNTICAFDVSAACTGFIYSLGVADSMIKAGTATTALVIGAERISQYLDWEERNTAVIFGDGAGAAVVKGSDEPGILSTHLHADGSKKDSLFLNNGKPVYEPAERANKVTMDGQDVFKNAVKRFSEVIDQCLTANNVAKEDIDWLVPHQANIRIIQAVQKKLAMKDDQVVVTVNKTANNSAATVPIALDIASRDGRVKPGQLVISAAFGAGLTWGALLLRF